MSVSDPDRLDKLELLLEMGDGAEGWHPEALKNGARLLIDNDRYEEAAYMLSLLAKVDAGRKVKNLGTQYLKQGEKERAYFCFCSLAAEYDCTPEELLREIPDGINIIRTLTGASAAENRMFHITKHFHDDLTRPHHGVFTISEERVYEVLKELKNYEPKKEGGALYYFIYYRNAGIDGGFLGTHDTLDYITVITFLNSSNIITAYPSCGTKK